MWYFKIWEMRKRRTWHDMTWQPGFIRKDGDQNGGNYDRMTLSKLYRARTERCYIKGVPAIWRCTGHGCHALFTLQYLLTLVRSGGEDLADGLMPIEPDGPLALPSLVLKWLVLLSPLAPWFPLSVQDGLNKNNSKSIVIIYWEKESLQIKLQFSTV